MDLWLLRALATELGPVREACEAVFRGRATHPWPPEVHVPDHWAGPFTRLAGEVGLPVSDVHEAAQGLRAYIREIAEGNPTAA